MSIVKWVVVFWKPFIRNVWKKELTARNVLCAQPELILNYKTTQITANLKPDLICYDQIILETQGSQGRITQSTKRR